MVLCGAFTLLGYIVARPFTSLERLGNNTLAIAITLLLTGFFLMFNRRKAITQVLGYIVVENGIYAIGVALVGGVPLLVELGVLLDIFVAVFIMSIAAYHISREFDHIDVSQLDKLRG